VANTTSAYRLSAYPAYEPASRDRRERADVRAVRTGADQRSSQDSSQLVALARMAAIVIAVFAVLCFARIALTSATVATMIESDSISTQIEEARATGVSLEMEQSVLTSPSAIKGAVKRLGMAAPGEVGTIELEKDVVALDEEGNLSLSDSLKNVARAQE
jgi:hypothetical protein